LTWRKANVVGDIADIEYNVYIYNEIKSPFGRKREAVKTLQTL